MNAFHVSSFIAAGFLLSSLIFLWDTYQTHRAIKRILTPPKDRKPTFPHHE